MRLQIIQFKNVKVGEINTESIVSLLQSIPTWIKQTWEEEL